MPSYSHTVDVGVASRHLCDLRAEPLGTARTSPTHSVTIQTKGLAKLLTPVITYQLKRQAPADLASLKVLAEKH